MATTSKTLKIYFNCSDVFLRNANLGLCSFFNLRCDSNIMATPPKTLQYLISFK